VSTGPALRSLPQANEGRADTEPMAAPRSPQAVLRSGARGEAGFSLIELLLSSTLLLVVLGATLSVLDTTARLGPRDQERPLAVSEAQVGLDRMVRELREASSVVGTTSTSMNVLVEKGGVQRQVLYQCGVAAPNDASNPYDDTYKRCVRRETSSGGAFTGAGTVVVQRRINQPVFTFSPSTTRPEYVKARIVVPARGERREGYAHNITLDDGFYIRNADL